MLKARNIITARNSSCRKVIFSKACVIPSVHRGGLHPGGSAYRGGLHPRGLHPGGLHRGRGECAYRGSASRRVG